MKSNTVGIVNFLSAAAFLILAGCARTVTPLDNSNAGPPGNTPTTIGGHMSTTLTVDRSPYLVNSTIVVDSSGILIIEAGVRLDFSDSTGMLVHGTLLAVGNPTLPVLFTSHSASWKGIQIVDSPYRAVLKFCIIENIDVATEPDTIRNGAVDVLDADVSVTSTIFRTNKGNNGGAVYIDQSHSFVSNDLFLGNTAYVFGGAIVSSRSSNAMVNNTFFKNISDNYASAVMLVSPVADSVQNNIFYSNTSRGADDGIVLYQTDSTHFVAAYNFLQTAGNPRFVSETDLHLQSTSPCLNAGNPAPRFNDPDGSRNDEGAYGGPLGAW